MNRVIGTIGILLCCSTASLGKEPYVSLTNYVVAAEAICLCTVERDNGDDTVTVRAERVLKGELDGTVVLRGKTGHCVMQGPVNRFMTTGERYVVFVFDDSTVGRLGGILPVKDGRLVARFVQGFTGATFDPKVSADTLSLTAAIDQIAAIAAARSSDAVEAMPEPADRGSVFLVFRWGGGHSPIKTATVTVTDTGCAGVAVEWYAGKPELHYSTQLSQDELADLSTRVDAARLFDATELEPSGFVKGAEVSITVAREGRKRTYSYTHDPLMAPVEQVCWKLITQAEVLREIEQDGDIYVAAGSVNPRTAGLKVLQPDRLTAPLMGCASTNTDRQKVGWSLEALACLLTPEAFAGFVARQTADPSRRDLYLGLVGTDSFTGNIPESHLEALCPLYLAFSRDAYPRRKALSDSERQALSEFADQLGEVRYQPGISMFRDWFEAHRKPRLDASLTPLATMGASSLGAVSPYLDSTNMCYRINAIQLLTISARLSPRAGYAHPLPEHEYNRMIPVFTNAILPRLLVLSTNDPSEKVRAKAAAAAVEIRKHATFVPAAR